MSSEAPTSLQALAEFAADILADARSLRDRVTDLENDGMEIRAVVDAVDRLHETAACAARELAAEADKFEDDVITRAEAEKLVDEDIGVMASEQIRQGLIQAKEAGLSDATAEACLRALPAIERKIESLWPMLENPQAMIPYAYWRTAVATASR